MAAPWRRVFPGTFQTTDVVFYKTPPGSLVSEAMLGSADPGSALNIPDTAPTAITFTGLGSDTVSRAVADASTVALSLLGLAATILFAMADVAPPAVTFTGHAGTVFTGNVVQDVEPAALSSTGYAGNLRRAVLDTAPVTQTLAGLQAALAMAHMDGGITGVALQGFAGTLGVSHQDTNPTQIAIQGWAGSVLSEVLGVMGTPRMAVLPIRTLQLELPARTVVVVLPERDLVANLYARTITVMIQEKP